MSISLEVKRAEWSGRYSIIVWVAAFFIEAGVYELWGVRAPKNGL